LVSPAESTVSTMRPDPLVHAPTVPKMPEGDWLVTESEEVEDVWDPVRPTTDTLDPPTMSTLG